MVTTDRTVATRFSVDVEGSSVANTVTVVSLESRVRMDVCVTVLVRSSKEGGGEEIAGTTMVVVVLPPSGALTDPWSTLSTACLLPDRPRARPVPSKIAISINATIQASQYFHERRGRPFWRWWFGSSISMVSNLPAWPSRSGKRRISSLTASL